MPKQVILTVQKVEVTGVSVRADEETGQITEMPISLHVTYDTGQKDETFYPWALLSAASKQKVADVLLEISGLIQAEYLS